MMEMADVLGGLTTVILTLFLMFGGYGWFKSRRGWLTRRKIKHMTGCSCPWMYQGYHPKRLEIQIFFLGFDDLCVRSLRDFGRIPWEKKPDYWLIRERDPDNNREWWQLGSRYKVRWQILDSQFSPFRDEPTKITLEDNHNLHALDLGAATTEELIRKILQVVTVNDCAHHYNLSECRKIQAPKP